MKGMLLPEFIIQKTLVSIFQLLRNDLLSAKEDKDTILYQILGEDEDGEPLKINVYNVFKQAKKIIKNEHNLSVNFGYNQEVANTISLHILLPSEQGSMAIGEDEGYITEEDENGNKQMYYTQTFDTTYQIMITSNNSSEVNLIYNILKSMLLMLVPHLELKGIRLPTFSGNDIVMQDDLVPVPIFHKVLNISFKYENNVPKLLQEKIIKKFFIVCKMVEE